MTLATRCFLYHEEEESKDHILIHCLKAKVLQGLISLFGVRGISFDGKRDLVGTDKCR